MCHASTYSATAITAITVAIIIIIMIMIVTDAEVQRGKGRVPVADYSLTAQALPDYAEVSSHTAMHADATHSPASSSSQSQTEEEEQAVPDYAEVSPQTAMHAAATQPVSSSSSRSHAEEEEGSGQGRLHRRAEDGGQAQNADLPSSSSSDLASSQQSHGSSCSSSSEHAQHQDRRKSRAAASTTTANGSKQTSHNGSKNMNAREGRGVYSFCMCPGGQIVPTTTNPEELCINGMSFRCANPASLVPQGRHALAEFLPNKQYLIICGHDNHAVPRALDTIAIWSAGLHSCACLPACLPSCLSVCICTIVSIHSMCLA